VGHEDPHPDGDPLNEAIDSLLGDEEEVRAGETDPSAAASDDPAAGLPEDTASVEGADEEDAAPPDTPDSGASALDAMDSVEQNAQALIEDAIDDLIDQDDEAAGSPAEDIASLEVDDLAGDDDGTMSLEELSAELDALDDHEELGKPSDSTPGASDEHDAVSGVDEALVDAEPGEVGADAASATEPGTEAELEPEAEPVSEAELREETETQPEQEQEPESESESEQVSVSDGDETVPASVEQLDDDELLSSIAGDLIDEPVGGEEAEATASAAPEQSDESVSDASSSASEVSDVDDELMSAAIDVLEDSGADAGVQEDAPADEAAVPADDDASSVENADPSGDLEDASTLADLDASLAGLGDDFLSGYFETPEGEVLSSDSIGGNDASALLEQLQIDDLNLEELDRPARAEGGETPADPPSPEAAPVASETPGEAAGGATVPAIPPKAQPKPNAAPFEREEAEEAEGEIPEVESIWQTTRRVLLRLQRAAWSQAKTHGVPLGAKLVILVNRPVEDRPAKLRDSIGYIALWTALLAMILWVYLVFVRESPTPTPTQAPSRMVEPGERIDPIRNAGVEP
ncbi:MAG: hypothetical protein ACF8LL_08610, partial [Phycisphaerales bacterium]